MKKKFLSLTLGSLLVSTLSAEDNGFFVSAGYQIGESSQMVKNTKGIQDLSDSYERLNNTFNELQCPKHSHQAVLRSERYQ